MTWASESPEATALHGTGLSHYRFMLLAAKLASQSGPTPKWSADEDPRARKRIAAIFDAFEDATHC